MKYYRINLIYGNEILITSDEVIEVMEAKNNKTTFKRIRDNFFDPSKIISIVPDDEKNLRVKEYRIKLKREMKVIEEPDYEMLEKLEKMKMGIVKKF